MEGDTVAEILHLDKARPVLNFFLCLIDKVNNFFPSMIRSRTSPVERKWPIPMAMAFSWDTGDSLIKTTQKGRRRGAAVLRAARTV